MCGVNLAAKYDVAVVGSGIVGLGHALAAHQRGLEVAVIDRATAINGSTIRNFGHVGTSVHVGEAGDYAIKTRELYLRLANEANFWLRQAGTVVVARHEDEMQVLREAGVGSLLNAEEVAELVPVKGAVGGALPAEDLQVDPRETAFAIQRWLEAQGVTFLWRTSAVGVEPGVLHTSRGSIDAETIIVAVNFDVDHLFPDIAEQFDIRRCGLDMMLTEGVGLERPLLTGSSMLRYSAFSTMPSAGAVRERYARNIPGLLEFDVNQMYTERPDGTLLVGDTHYIGTTIAPFQDERAFELLHELGNNLFGTTLKVKQRWQGIYAKAAEDFIRTCPMDGVRIVTVGTGIGMTTGLGLAASVIDELYGPA